MEKTRLPGNLYYLTGRFPGKYGLYEKLAERLQQKGYRSNSGKAFSFSIINNIVRGAIQDERVRLELIEMWVEYNSGKESIAYQQVKHLLNEAERLLQIAQGMDQPANPHSAESTMVAID